MRIWLNDGADSFHPVFRSQARESAGNGSPSAISKEDVAAEAAFRTLQRYAPFDLLSGLAVPGQETHEWLVAAGYPAGELAQLAADPVTIDVIGLDWELVASLRQQTADRLSQEGTPAGEEDREAQQERGRAIITELLSREGTERLRAGESAWNQQTQDALARAARDRVHRYLLSADAGPEASLPRQDSSSSATATANASVCSASRSRNSFTGRRLTRLVLAKISTTASRTSA